MVIQLGFSEQEAHIQHLLWQIAQARATRDSAASAIAFEMLHRATAGLTPEETLNLGVDTIVDYTLLAADEANLNPACLTEAMGAQLHHELNPPTQVLLRAAYESLTRQDPTGESGSPHDVCHPWHTDTPVARINTVPGLATETAQAFARALTGTQWATQPGMAAHMATPDLLSRWAVFRAASDPDKFLELLRAGQTP